MGVTPWSEVLLVPSGKWSDSSEVAPPPPQVALWPRQQLTGGGQAESGRRKLKIEPFPEIPLFYSVYLGLSKDSSFYGFLPSIASQLLWMEIGTN